MKKRVAQFMVGTECPTCHGKRLRPESLSIKFANLDIAEISRLPLKRLATVIRPYAHGAAPGFAKLKTEHPEKAIVTQRICEDLAARLTVLLDLGLGYLSLERSTPTVISDNISLRNTATNTSKRNTQINAMKSPVHSCKAKRLKNRSVSSMTVAGISVADVA